MGKAKLPTPAEIRGIDPHFVTRTQIDKQKVALFDELVEALDKLIFIANKYEGLPLLEHEIRMLKPLLVKAQELK